MRKTTALIAAIVMLGALTACSSGTAVAACGTSTVPGSASESVSVSGKLGSPPKVTFPTPLKVGETQASSSIAGSGEPLQDGQSAFYSLSIYNGRTGALVQKSAYGPIGDSTMTIGPGADIAAVAKGLKCAANDSRTVIVGNAKDSHDSKPYQGIAKNDALVFVVDVRDTFPAKASGAAQVPQTGLPAVVTTPNGTPGITIPGTPAPKSSEVDVLTLGSGAALKKKDVVLVKLTGVSWNEQSVFDSTWFGAGDGTGQARIVQLGSASFSTGLSSALVGKTIGSQVLVVLPAKNNVVADGSGKAPTGTAVVYVVDILGVAG